MKIAILSDTHMQHENIQLPDDTSNMMLICAGDVCNLGTWQELANFSMWFQLLNFRYKVFVPGNHDVVIEHGYYPTLGLLRGNTKNIFMLWDDVITIQNLTILGIPYSLPIGNWAFMKNEDELEKVFKRMPDDVSIIVSHGPPHGICDIDKNGKHCGSRALLNFFENSKASHLICGHIHESYGREIVGERMVMNASMCDSDYNPTNRPLVFEI